MHASRMLMLALVMALGFVALGHDGALAGARLDPWWEPIPTTPDRTAQVIDDFHGALDRGSSTVEYFAPDASLTFGDTGRFVRGGANVAAGIEALYHDAFAGRMMVTASVISIGRAAVAGRLVGTQVGEFEGLAPTGRSFDVPFAAFYELENNVITSMRLDFSVSAILDQLMTTPDGEIGPVPGYPGDAF